jgi:hypothetical protein
LYLFFFLEPFLSTEPCANCARFFTHNNPPCQWEWPPAQQQRKPPFWARGEP